MLSQKSELNYPAIRWSLFPFCLGSEGERTPLFSPFLMRRLLWYPQIAGFGQTSRFEKEMLDLAQNLY